MTNNDSYRYEPVERFGASMTSPRPWNKTLSLIHISEPTRPY